MCQYGFFHQQGGIQIVNLTCAWEVMVVPTIQQARKAYPFGIEYMPGPRMGSIGDNACRGRKLQYH